MCDEIITILGGITHFWQWDLNRKLVINYDEPIFQVNFGDDENPIAVNTYEENGMILADVPNILLQNSGLMRCWLYLPADDGGVTLVERVFHIADRPKPFGYAYTETEILTWYQLDERITDLEVRVDAIEESGT